MSCIIIKRYILIASTIVCFGNGAASQKHILVKVVLASYRVGDLAIDVSNDQNEWSEWYDAATFRILEPIVWKDDTLTIYFPSEKNNYPFRAVVGTKYEFTISKENINKDSDIQIFSDVLLRFKEIKND